MTDRPVDQNGRVVAVNPVAADGDGWSTRRTFLPSDAAEFNLAKRRGIAGQDPLGTPLVRGTPVAASVPPEAKQAAPEPPQAADDKWTVIYPGWDRWRH